MAFTAGRSSRSSVREIHPAARAIAANAIDNALEMRPSGLVCAVVASTCSSDLPPAALGCVNGVGATHIHPSWRDFAGIPLTAVPPDRYEITFTDVPVGTRITFRINDQNSSDENPTGAVTRNVFANDVRLVQNATTPGNGDEPGYAMTVAADGRISQ